MNIKFRMADYLVKNIDPSLAGIHEDIEALKHHPETGKKLLRTVKAHIQQRLKLLEEEILAEEQSRNNEPYILMDFHKHPFEVKYFSYSPQLTAKMKNSIPPSDFDYLERFGGIK